MTLRHAFAALLVLAVCGVSNAGLREFTLTFAGSPVGNALSPTAAVMGFSYADGAFDDDIVSSGELLTTFSVNHANFAGTDFTLSQIDNLTDQYLLKFVAPDNSSLTMQLNALIFQQPSGTDLPNGVETMAFTAYRDSVGDPISEFNVNNPSVTIGTAEVPSQPPAIPEPSAFGFGLLALTVTGLGRWIRRRFWG